MIKDYKKFLRVSQVLNSSFGDNGPGYQHINGMNVKVDPVDDNLLKAKCTMLVSFHTDQMMRELMRKYRDEAVAMIKGAMDRISEDYKSRFDESIDLTMDDKSLDESIEFVQVAQYNAVNRAFYRVNTLIKIS